jgi:hypothetical protein
MSQFEKIYQIDSEREKYQSMDKHPSIELSDQEYLSKFVPSGQYVKFNRSTEFDDSPLKVSKKMEEAGWVYREPCKVDEHSSEVLKQKHALAEALCKESFTIILNNEPPPIPMNLDMPRLEKAIKEGKKNAKSKSKSTKGKSKKDNPKSNKPAMESI